MMMKQFFTRTIASDKVVARIGQAVCFGGACLIPVLVFRRFAQLELPEAQLITGVLATMTMALVLTLSGVLLEPKTKTA